MSWDIVLEIIIATIVSAGGISGIIIAVVKFTTGIIAEKLSKKYETTLNKELELYRTQLGKREYVSKTRFDTEFGIYRELSRVFFDYVRAVCVLIPPGYSEQPADDELKRKLEYEQYKAANNALIAAQDTLHQNAPFIQKDFFIKYDELLRDGHRQMYAYTRRFNIFHLAAQIEENRFSLEDYNRSENMMNYLQELSDDIRQYLAKLDVAD